MMFLSKRNIIIFTPLLILIFSGIIAGVIFWLPNAFNPPKNLANITSIENTPTPQITIEPTSEITPSATPINQLTPTENNKTTTSALNVTTPTKSTPTRIRMRCSEERESELTSEISVLPPQINSLQLKLDTELKACQNKVDFNTDTYLLPPCETAYTSCLSEYPNNSLTCEESKKICIYKANGFRYNQMQACAINYEGNMDLYGNYRNEDVKRLNDLKLQLLHANAYLQFCKTPI